MAINDNELKELLFQSFAEPTSTDYQKAGFACPREETLADFLHNTLQEQIKEDVERHLRHCQKCLQEILLGAQLMEVEQLSLIKTQHPIAITEKALTLIPPAKPSINFKKLKQFKNKCIKIIKKYTEIFYQEPEFVYVRGNKKVISKNLVVVEKIFEKLKLEIAVEKVSSGTADIKIKTSKPGTGAHVNGIRVNISDDSKEIASFVTANGEALFENIDFGDYTIVVLDTKRKLGEVLLTIKE